MSVLDDLCSPDFEKKLDRVVLGVTLNELNWVTPETIRDTYAFFSAAYEKDYEMYSRVYKNVAFYPAQKALSIGELSPLIEGIVSQ